MLFALVPTGVLAQTDPDLVDEHDDSNSSPSPRSSCPCPTTRRRRPRNSNTSWPLMSWPAAVAGCALVQEIIVLPPQASDDLDEAFVPLLADPEAADAAARDTARSHPGQQQARLIAGALRDGSRLAYCSCATPLTPRRPDGWSCCRTPISRRESSALAATPTLSRITETFDLHQMRPDCYHSKFSDRYIRDELPDGLCPVRPIRRANGAGRTHSRRWTHLSPPLRLPGSRPPGSSTRTGPTSRWATHAQPPGHRPSPSTTNSTRAGGPTTTTIATARQDPSAHLHQPRLRRCRERPPALLPQVRPLGSSNSMGSLGSSSGSLGSLGSTT